MPANDLVIVASRPTDNVTWTVVARTTDTYNGTDAWLVEAYAICATVVPSA